MRREHLISEIANWGDGIKIAIASGDGIWPMCPGARFKAARSVKLGVPTSTRVGAISVEGSKQIFMQHSPEVASNGSNPVFMGLTV